MIYSDRLRIFLHALDGPDASADMRDKSSSVPDRRKFEELRKQQESDGIPIIRREMESFLQVLLELRKPERILEVGAAEGFSSLWMSSCTEPETTVTTIEQDSERAQRARDNFSSFPCGSRISLIEGDATDVLHALGSRSYDFVFMDAAKAQYINFLPDVLRVMKTGAVLVSDNVLQDGMILDPLAAVSREDRTIYHRMREYLRVLKQTEGLLTTIVPIGDGAAVTVRRKDICTDRENFRSC